MQHRKQKHDEHKTVFIWSKWCNSFTYIRAVKQWVSFFCSSSFTLKSMQAWLRSFKRCIHHPSHLHSNKQNLIKERKVTSKLWKIYLENNKISFKLPTLADCIVFFHRSQKLPRKTVEMVKITHLFLK